MSTGAGDWYVNAPTHLMDLYLNGQVTEERREVLMLVGVLADEVNVGFHSFKDAVVERVNGREIGSMVDLVAAFTDNREPYHVVEDDQGFRIVLDRQKVAAANQAILKKYKVDRDRSADLVGR